jgi:hypothetical protein
VLAVMQMQAAIASAVPLISVGDLVVYKRGSGGVFTVVKLADREGQFLLGSEDAKHGVRDLRFWSSRDEFEPAAAATSTQQGHPGDG